MTRWTLNDNPRVTAEKRRALLHARLYRVIEAYGRVGVERDASGKAVRMHLRPLTWATLRKKQREIKRIHQHLREVEHFLATFR